MNRTAIPIRSRSRRSFVNHSLAVVAKLDLEDEGQRRLHALVLRFHTGRWPLFRCLGMRQVNGVLYEAVEWLRMTKPTFKVVEWLPHGSGMRFHPASSARDAKLLLARLA